MIHFKVDRHALRWPKIRESKLADYIRYTFQPGFSLFVLVIGIAAPVAAVLEKYSLVWLYYGIVGVVLSANFLRWRKYRGFK